MKLKGAKFRCLGYQVKQITRSFDAALNSFVYQVATPGGAHFRVVGDQVDNFDYKGAIQKSVGSGAGGAGKVLTNIVDIQNAIAKQLYFEIV